MTKIRQDGAIARRVLHTWRWLRSEVLLLLVCGASIPAFTAPAASPPTIEAYIAPIASEQDARVAATLARIEGSGRKLLALRSYLRNSAHLAERWSWTAAQIAAYDDSCERHALQAEIERVRVAFAQASPGFVLYVNPAVRSLDLQVDAWNTNESVGAAAANLLDDVRALLASPRFPIRDPQLGREAVQAFLVSYVPEPTPALAAPGLSPHGQMRAVDFQVEGNGRIVAAPDTRTVDSVWVGQGWAAKLDAAVRASTTRLVGPLASPREPWHYTFAAEGACLSATKHLPPAVAGPVQARRTAILLCSAACRAAPLFWRPRALIG